jgi:von Willebrand factor type A domain/Aerotolerance regulator N-terminal
MWPEWTNTLSAWQWAALAAVPPAIVALYFLKLKREPLEVPSTFLWRKSIEDLRVNSLWQRLRQSLLLLLQLLLIALVLIALGQPSWRGSKLSGDRFIFLVDNSASMGATDVEGNRLEEAKRRVGELIDEMKTGDVAMIISFADGARVEQLFTDDRGQLRRRLELIELTDKPTSLPEALRLASVLANPGQIATDALDTPVADALPAKLLLFSDGNVGDVPDFSLGNLEPVRPVWIGRPDAANVAIVAFSTDRVEGAAGKLQAFARLENSGPKDVSIAAELLLNGELIDAQQLAIPAGESRGMAFDLGELRDGVLQLRTAAADSLAIDDRAWTVIHPPRRARVLVVSPGNEPLKLALATDRVAELADVAERAPDYLATKEYQAAAAGGAYDLIIYDRCAPERMPRANTLLIGRLPPGGAWKAEEKRAGPQIIDTQRSHPMMQWVELGNVIIVEATPLKPPPGSTVLVDSDRGPLLAVGPREGFEDAVMAFELISGETIGTNWPVRPSFPVFVLNALRYLGGVREGSGAGSVRPGRPVALKSSAPVERLTVVPPTGDPEDVPRGKLDTFHFAATSHVGVYDVKEQGQVTDHFAVNLFDPAESDVKVQPEKTIRIGHVEITGQANWEGGRRAAWKLVLVGALAILLFEWYIYTRRTYL